MVIGLISRADRKALIIPGVLNPQNAPKPNYAQWHVTPENCVAFEADGYDMDPELVVDAEIDRAVCKGITALSTSAAGTAPVAGG